MERRPRSDDRRTVTARWTAGRAGLLALAAAAAASALGLAACGSSGSKKATSVTVAPVQVTATTRGTVAYRSVGSGPPIVLIMGLASSMEDWAPTFVDDLARAHRVVILDNAGIGRTAPLKKVTISGMADQTSALIDALHLGRSDVLGWSMGGLVAQALTVRHPGNVHRLVLAATQPGTGTAKPIPEKAAKAIATATPEQFLALLFPADQAGALKAYADGIGQYKVRATVPDAVAGAQSAAIHGWLAGAEKAGHALSTTIPTLVADGRQDAFNPVANSRLLTRRFSPSQLVLYPDAGHAFLFQDYQSFVARVNSFLAAKS